MRNKLISQAFDEATRVVDDALDEVIGNTRKPNEKRMAVRYVELHRGNPFAMAEFVATRAPRGANPLKEMRRYEEKMEALARRYGLVR